MIQESVFILPYTIGNIVLNTMQQSGFDQALIAFVARRRLQTSLLFGNFDKLKTHNALSDNISSNCG